METLHSVVYIHTTYFLELPHAWVSMVFLGHLVDSIQDILNGTSNVSV